MSQGRGQKFAQTFRKSSCKGAVFLVFLGSGQEVCFGPPRPDPGKKHSGAGWDQDGPGWPYLGTGWVQNAVKQSTWRIWTGPLQTRDGIWTGPGSDPGEGLDGTLRDSNRLLGLSEFRDFGWVFVPLLRCA